MKNKFNLVVFISFALFIGISFLSGYQLGIEMWDNFLMIV